MPAVILSMLTIGAFSCTLVGLFIHWDSLGNKKVLPIALSSLIACCVWWGFYGQTDWMIEETLTLECVNVNGSQVIAIPYNTQVDLINVNLMFEKTFDDNQKFLVEKYKKKYYAGLIVEGKPRKITPIR